MPRPPNSSLFLLLLLLSVPSHLFSSFVTLALSLTHPQDVAALKAFKAAIDPSSIPRWSCLASWDFSAADPCAVPHRTHFLCGLNCNPDASRVESITLDPVGYSGTLSPPLSKLAQLTKLDLSDNSFHGPIPFASFSSLSRLESLSLGGNSFSGSVSPAVGKLSSLQELDLSRNLLSGSIPHTLSSLSGLTRMDLSNNKLTGSIPELPPNLVELVIRSNSLSGTVTESAFAGSTRLEVVDLSANSLSGPLLGWIFNLPSLQQVNLSNNSLTHLEVSRPGSGSGGLQLVSVDLGFNRIEGYVPVNFLFYPSLWALSLRYNRLRGRIPLQFGMKGSHIKRLFLDGNFLIGKPPAGFFYGGGSVAAGSFGDNCLQECPRSSQLCLPSQKPTAVCRQAYRDRKKRRPRS